MNELVNTNLINERELQREPPTVLAHDVQDADPESVEAGSRSGDVSKFIIKVPRPDSKLILQNMEEVLNSVKKKHRQKHRKKREQKKLAQMEAAAAGQEIKPKQVTALENDEGNSDEANEEPAISKGEAKQTEMPETKEVVKPHGKRSKTQPLQEKTVQDINGLQAPANGGKRKKKMLENKSPVQNGGSGTSNGGILRHFHRAPNQNDETAETESAINSNKNTATTSATTANQPKAMNAFEVMMNARNKTIGSNTPGKETSPTASSQASTVNTKRKLMLQEWADKKGAGKRKLDEESRAAFVEQQLEHRAKRLKKMLAQGPSPKQENLTNRKQNDRKREKKSINVGNAAEQSKRKRRSAIRLEPSDSSNDEEEISKVDSETEEFLAKLNSPTKKRDSLLGYFPRKESPTDHKKETPKSTKALKVKDEGSAKSVKNAKDNADKQMNRSKKTETAKSRAPRRSTKSNKEQTAVAADTSTLDKNTLPTAETQLLDKNSSTTTDTETLVENPLPTKDENQGKEECETAKSVEALKLAVETIKTDVETTETVEAAVAEQTPTGRPKRSCAGKARYDYDLEVSPTKLECAKRVTGKTTKKRRETECIDIEEIIQLDDSNASWSPDSGQPKKLAPVFMRAVPKPSPDPIALKARQDFLMSGVPEKIRLEIEKQKQYEQTYEEEFDYFPRISHIQQLSGRDIIFLQYKSDFALKLKPCDYALDAEEEEAKSTMPAVHAKTSKRKSRNSNSGSTPKMKSQAKLAQHPPPKAQSLSTTITLLPNIDNKRAIIKNWKSEFERFPTFKCYNQMREKYRFFSALDSAQDTEQVSESFVVTRRTLRKRNDETAAADPTSSTGTNAAEQEDAQPPATAPNGELLFTEKYKPMLVEQVLVNLVPVIQLRDFLAVWANASGSGSGGSGGSSARNSQNIDDSFDASNDDSNCSFYNNSSSGTAVVLLGPVSSGKTNAVYALANDMNFNVLEINAGMKRTGKRLIQELQEATQSHQIRKDSTPTQSASKAQKNLLRMSLNGKKTKKTQNSQQTHTDGDSNGSCSTLDAQHNTRKCLILIEDADVVFEQFDSGFTDAIYTLAASSKRPVIVMATNPNCAHLQRLMHQNTIYFTPPNALNISRYMAVLSLIENCPINLDDLLSLYLYNGKDLRRTLLELQFFIQSGGDHCRQQLTNATIGQQQQAQRQRTPKKSASASAIANTNRELSYFASPTKSQLAADEQADAAAAQPQQLDEQLGRERVHGVDDSRSKCSTDENVYVHRKLFDFFTCNQNEKWRIPFPVDFALLRVNLAEVFQSAQLLQIQAQSASGESKKPTNDNEQAKSATLKRRTRTPKKICCSKDAATHIEDGVSEKSQHKPTATKMPMAVLCDFYENISVATLLGTTSAFMSDSCSNSSKRNAVGGSANTSDGDDSGVDRLLPNPAEHIAHELVEQAIGVNLAAKACPYNLFNTAEQRLSLCDYMNSNNAISSRSQRTRALDIEPALRAICRSERQRAMQERRSTRFYHYLRHGAVNFASFSTEPFDRACAILQNDEIVSEYGDEGDDKVKHEG